MGSKPRRQPASLLLLLTTPLACGADEIYTLGQGEFVPTFSDGETQCPPPAPAICGRRPRNIRAPGENNDSDDDNPTLTEDLLDIFFTSDRDEGLGGADVWSATRATRADPFEPPDLVGEASTMDDDTSAAISSDGLTLWVGSDQEGGAGGTDIYQLTRPSKDVSWSTPRNLAALNSEDDDIPRPVGQGGLVMPMASRRGPGDEYQTYFATRPSLDADFGAPEPLAYLWVEGSSMVDAFLTDDGLLLFFNRDPGDGDGELYMAWRPSTDDLFRDPVPLVAVNSPADDRDPWLSVDGRRFFFASDRGGATGLDIYFTTVELPRFE